MKKSIKKLWLKALRSGAYEQATHTLREGSGSRAKYCCLGVLCQLHNERLVADGLVTVISVKLPLWHQRFRNGRGLTTTTR